MSGIYLHIPFCKQACYYCDFHFSTNTQIRRSLVEAMQKEIVLQQAYLGHEPVKTIYFGGGTPSLLEPDEIRALLKTIHSVFVVQEDAEITLEANPDDLDATALHNLKDLGINRLSIGIQSFYDPILRFLNRAHDANTAVRSVILAREAGFANINIDLIYAIPGLTNQQWEDSIQKAIALHPEHISAYALTIEEKTLFGHWHAKGKLTPVDEETNALQLEMLIERLERAGFEHYGISNFCKPGFFSRHNSRYWEQEPYLGIGPGAHSYNRASRQFNVPNNHVYVRALQKGNIPFNREILTPADHVNEYLLTRLRTYRGCDLNILKRDYQYDVQNIHSRYLETLQAQNLITIEGSVLKLTRQGKLLADKIASDLFLLAASDQETH